MTIHAIYENGVFRPTAPVSLPEQTEVEFEPKVVAGNGQAQDDAMQAVYEVMSQRFRSEKGDLSERHNEHQP